MHVRRHLGVDKPNKMQGWHYDKGHFHWPIFRLVQLSLLKGQCYTEKSKKYIFQYSTGPEED